MIDGVPETADELGLMLTISGFNKLYGDIANAAVIRRLTENDIALIERRVLNTVFRADDFADEFKNFEAEVVAANIRHLFKELFDMLRDHRISRSK